MKIGKEDRKKLILAVGLGVVALGTIVYELGGSSDTTPSVAAPPPVARSSGTPNPVAHVSRSSLDPTLHPEGMQLAESVVYTGSGRNIFSMASAAPKEIRIEKPLAPARVAPAPTQPVYSGPPPLPPIELRFFGTAQRQGGRKQAFFLKGDDVFLAGEGDIVSRRYKIGPIATTSVQVTDLTNNNTQTLPLMQQ